MMIPKSAAPLPPTTARKALMRDPKKRSILSSMKKLTFLLLLFSGLVFLQAQPQVLQTTQAFTTATTGNVIQNDPTLSGGPAGWIAFRMVYYIQAGSGTVSALSVELDGAATSGGSYSALTPAVGGGSGSGSTLNPVTSFPQGQNVLCCDFYPFLKIKVNTLTVSTGSPILIVKVIGYAGTSAAAGTGGGGGGSGITALTQDVLASGSGSVAATVVGIDTVPLCSGFAPANGQFLEYTTGGSPSPCYGASVATGGVHCTARFNPSSGAIASLSVTGCITGVTYSSLGHYTITVSSPPSNYVVLLSVGDEVRNPTAQTHDTLGATSFIVEVISISPLANYDPNWVFVAIP